MSVHPQKYFDIKKEDGETRYRIAYDDLGNPDDPTPIFCTHGLGQTRHSLDVLAAELVKQNRRVLNVDLVGHGASEWAEDPQRYAVPFYAQDCAQMITSLGLAAIDWIGISLGGLVGIRIIAEHHINVRHLIMADVAPEVPMEVTAWLADWYERPNIYPDKESFLEWRVQCTQEFGPLTDERRRERGAYDFRILPDGTYTNIYDKGIAVNLRRDTLDQRAWNDWELYKKITCPTLVFHGEESVILTSPLIEKLKTVGPKARVIDIAWVGHYPTLEDEYQIGCVSKFLNNTL